MSERSRSALIGFVAGVLTVVVVLLVLR